MQVLGETTTYLDRSLGCCSMPLSCNRTELELRRLSVRFLGRLCILDSGMRPSWCVLAELWL